ncbi:MAG: J domain-containing protein [Pseudomonadota bacterium]
MLKDQHEDEHCERVPALIERTNREPLEAYLFLRPGQRPSDLLNDRRAFLPAAALDGRFILIAKQTIEEIEPRTEGVNYDDDEDQDPYEILGVSPDAPLREVVVAYKERLKRLHPDAVRAAGLDQELVNAADGLTKQINLAYQTVRRRMLRDDRLRPRRG